MRAARRPPFQRHLRSVSAPQPTEFGTLQTLASHAAAEKAGGLGRAMVELEWRYWQPTATTSGVGVRNTGTYVANIVATIQGCVNAGLKVTLGLGLHHPPTWVAATYGSDVLYKNQSGQESTAAVLRASNPALGFDAIDFTLSAKARQLAEAYVADVKAALVTAGLWTQVAGIRDAISNTGEQMYPQRENSGYDWWAYSARAQAGTGLAAGMTAAPNVGVPTGAQVVPWLQWYQDARAKTSLWMIDYLCGALGFAGTVDVITPGSGVRPSAWTALLAGTSLPSGNLAGAGVAWHILYASLNAGPWAGRTIMYCSSIADGSGSNTPPQAGDDALALTDTAANSWGSARWFRFMSRKFTNLAGLAGENPGAGTGYATTMMPAMFAIIAAGGWRWAFWAHEDKLWDGTIPIQTYYNHIATSRGALPALSLTAGDFKAAGSTVRLAGANFYDAITSDAGTSPGNLQATPGDVRRATLDQLVATGHNAVRCHTLFIGYGKAGTQLPTTGAYAEAVLVRCDEFLAECRARGLYVMAPLTDSWDFYHGGAITFANMVLGGTRTADQARTEFCTNATVITAFRAYVSTLMNRVNTVTGIAWKDDPTLAIIETANEAWQSAFMAGSPNYHAQTAAWLKANWPNKLVADGFACSGSGAIIPAHSLGNPNFDVVGTHFYDDMRNNITFLNTEAARASTANQAFVLGEWDWRDVQANGPAINNAGVTRQQLLTAMDGNPNVNGSFWWVPRITGRNHNGAYQLYLDTPTSADQTSAKAQFTAFNSTFKN